MIHVNFSEKSEITDYVTRLHFNMQAFLHGLVPKEVFHVLQKFVEPEIANEKNAITIVSFEFIGVDM